MKTLILLIAMATTALTTEGFTPKMGDKEDILTTKAGTVKMKFLGHASLLFQVGNKNIYVDPSGAYAKFDGLPKADIIFYTHEHFDHLDPKTAKLLVKDGTIIVGTAACKEVKPTIIMKNGDTKEIDGIKVEAVAAYNLIHKNDQGNFYHPKGVGNGYILTIGSKRIYIAGDTEDIPEMKTFKNVDVAFMPMNLPYTMSPEMFERAALMVKPKVLYPYHYAGSDLAPVKKAIEKEKGIEVRLKNFY